MHWLHSAEPGEVKYKDEGHWLMVHERLGDRILIRNFDAPEYIAVKVVRASHIDLHSMD